MKNKKMFMLQLVILITFVIGCQNEQDTNKKNDGTAKQNEGTVTQSETVEVSGEEKLTIDVDPLPQTIEEIVNYPIGKYANYTNINEEIINELKTLQPLEERAAGYDIEKYFTYVYSLFKMNYPAPGLIMEEYSFNSENGSRDDIIQSEVINVQFILDSSGSMASKMGSKSRMELAKDSIQKFASSLPEDANVALRVYGHGGSNSEQDKAKSCASNELVYSLQSYDATTLANALNAFKPTGWTPLADAMRAALEDFKSVDQQNSRNIIFIVSDGIETCNGNPVEAAKLLKDSGLSPIVNIIGFDLDHKGQSQLMEVAKEADGSYVNVKNQQQLSNEIKKTLDEIIKWNYWRTNASSSASEFYNKQLTKIYGMNNEWTTIKVKENLNIQMALLKLKEFNIITNEQYSAMEQMRKEQQTKQAEQIRALRDSFAEINENNYETNLNKVYEIYKKNTANP